MPHSLIFGIPNHISFSIAIVIVGTAIAILALRSLGPESWIRPRLREAASSGWLPASILAVFATVVLAAYGTPIPQTAIFGAYVIFGIALPGMLWVRLFRGRAAHVSEDLTLGLAVGYCLEMATYVAARAVGAPLLFVLWPISTLIAFAAIPALRRHWRGSGARVPVWWSWGLAVMLGYLLIYSAGTFFVSHHLTGTDTPYVDMPYHLALIGELINHAPPQIPYVSGVPLAYHWFFYADAAATSWATGIEPVTLLYRLSGLPMFVAFVVLTATAAGRLTGRSWTGPVAVAVALFGTVADPYSWTGTPVFDTQTINLTWISPTNLFGLALFAAIVLAFIDLLQTDKDVPRRYWLLIALLVFGAAGAKASLLPLLIVGLLAVIAGFAICCHRLHGRAVAGLAAVGVGLVLATILLYLGMTRGLVIGLDSLRSLPVVSIPGDEHTGGMLDLVMPIVGWLIAVLLWSFLWAGAYGLIARRHRSSADAPILLLVGIGAGGLGAVTVFSYPGLSQVYYLTVAAGAFGVLTAAGIAAVVPARARYLPLIVCVSVAALVGAGAVLIISKLGPANAPTLAQDHLSGVLPVIIVPVLALLGVAIITLVVLRLAAPRWPVLQGSVPLLVIAVVMGFSLPNVANVLASPIHGGPPPGLSVAGDGIDVARWLRDHSDPDDLVATNLHCAWYTTVYDSCNPVSFWVSAYSERRVLVEGWTYTTRTIVLPSGQVAPFWDPALLAANDSAFTDPSAAAIAKLRDGYGVRWLFADLTGADSDSLGRYADLRYREGDFAVYELLGP